MLINLKEGEYLGQALKSFNYSWFRTSITGYGSNCEIEKHFHDNNYISILLDGKYIERNVFGKSLISPGSIIFRPCYYAHENFFERDGGTCFNIEFKTEWQTQFDETLKLPHNVVNYSAGTFPSLYRVMLISQIEHNEELAYEFLCDWLFQINQKKTVKGNLQWIEKVVQILENEVEYFHSLLSLSGRVSVHPVYLARAFKERKGMTIGEYQLKAKLANAVALLLNTSFSISDISYKNGFFDDAHFIRTFKSVYKTSPHQFRLSVKKLI
jgi:AraC family transcriptional regulator